MSGFDLDEEGVRVVRGCLVGIGISLVAIGVVVGLAFLLAYLV